MSVRHLTSRVTRLSLGAQASLPRASSSRLPTLPTLQRTVRCMSTQFDPSALELGNLWPLHPTKTRKRVGRGPSSGRGGTATRGHKGQKARAGNGKPTPGFEGGQTPLMRRYPKRGFTNKFAKEYVTLNIERIQEWIDLGRLDPSKPITTRELFESRCIHSYGDGIKLLARNSTVLQSPIHIIVSKASRTAIQQIERKGGSILCKYYTPITLRALVKPHKYEGKVLPRDANPISKKELIWYSNVANRGYLANLTPDRRPPKVTEEEEDVIEVAQSERGHSTLLLTDIESEHTPSTTTKPL